MTPPTPSPRQECIPIDDSLAIPLSELTFQFARSGGPGGQHVNKTETKVLLQFDIAQSPSLTESQRKKLFDRLASRLTKEGVLQLAAQSTRSQLKNKQEVIARLQELLRVALIEPKKRRPTKPSRRAKQRRLDEKKRRGERKKERQKKWTE